MARATAGGAATTCTTTLDIAAHDHAADAQEARLTRAADTRRLRGQHTPSDARLLLVEDCPLPPLSPCFPSNFPKPKGTQTLSPTCGFRRVGTPLRSDAAAASQRREGRRGARMGRHGGLVQVREPEAALSGRRQHGADRSAAVAVAARAGEAPQAVGGHQRTAVRGAIACHQRPDANAVGPGQAGSHLRSGEVTVRARGDCCVQCMWTTGSCC